MLFAAQVRVQGIQLGRFTEEQGSWEVVEENAQPCFYSDADIDTTGVSTGVLVTMQHARVHTAFDACMRVCMSFVCGKGVP